VNSRRGPIFVARFAPKEKLWRGFSTASTALSRFSDTATSAFTENFDEFLTVKFNGADF